MCGVPRFTSGFPYFSEEVIGHSLSTNLPRPFKRSATCSAARCRARWKRARKSVWLRMEPPKSAPPASAPHASSKSSRPRWSASRAVIAARSTAAASCAAGCARGGWRGASRPCSLVPKLWPKTSHTPPRAQRFRPMEPATVSAAVSAAVSATASAETLPACRDAFRGRGGRGGRARDWML